MKTFSFEMWGKAFLVIRFLNKNWSFSIVVKITQERKKYANRHLINTHISTVLLVNVLQTSNILGISFTTNIFQTKWSAECTPMDTETDTHNKSNNQLNFEIIK